MLALDYLHNVGSSVSVHAINKMAEVLEPFMKDTSNEAEAHSLANHIILMDIENGKQARVLHDQILVFKKNDISFACVTDTQPEQLKTILQSQWQCPIISHPFTPTEFFLFANQIYDSDSFFASHSDKFTPPEQRLDINKSTRPINTKIYEGHVLLVEDNSINQMVAGEMLHSFGLTFDIAEDGEQALTKVQNSPYYDLILMDVQMPIMDGNKATQAIREAGHTDIPIVGLSANAMQQDYANAKTSGMNEYLTKPIKRETLRLAIERYLEEQK